jgi:hypothetical protein
MVCKVSVSRFIDPCMPRKATVSVLCWDLNADAAVDDRREDADGRDFFLLDTEGTVLGGGGEKQDWNAGVMLSVEMAETFRLPL